MTGKFYFKVHNHPSETIMAICDEEILGQTFRGGKLKIDVTQGFYGGEVVDEEFITSNLQAFTILNVVGNRIVDIAIREGIISEDAVIQIGEVKHAQAVRL